MKKIIKAIIAQTPYRIVSDRGANRFQVVDVALTDALLALCFFKR